VLEVVTARARGIRCLGISTITNPAAGVSHEALDHADVLEVGKRVADDLATIVEGVGEQRA
jgi:purine-nucleoside phosphorylase